MQLASKNNDVIYEVQSSTFSAPFREVWNPLSSENVVDVVGKGKYGCMDSFHEFCCSRLS